MLTSFDAHLKEKKATLLPCTRAILGRLLGIKFFYKLDTKPEKVGQLLHILVILMVQKKKREKDVTSAAASISACHTFFPCPKIVAAKSLYLYFPLTRSAALRKIAARSFQGSDSHFSFAASAPSIAFATVASSAS